MSPTKEQKIKPEDGQSLAKRQTTALFSILVLPIALLIGLTSAVLRFFLLLLILGVSTTLGILASLCFLMISISVLLWTWMKSLFLAGVKRWKKYHQILRDLDTNTPGLGLMTTNQGFNTAGTRFTNVTDTDGNTPYTRR